MRQEVGVHCWHAHEHCYWILLSLQWSDKFAKGTSTSVRAATWMFHAPAQHLQSEYEKVLHRHSQVANLSCDCEHMALPLKLARLEQVRTSAGILLLRQQQAGRKGHLQCHGYDGVAKCARFYLLSAIANWSTSPLSEHPGFQRYAAHLDPNWEDD